MDFEVYLLFERSKCDATNTMMCQHLSIGFAECSEQVSHLVVVQILGASHSDA